MKKTQLIWVVWIILLIVASGAMFYFTVVLPGIPTINTLEDASTSSVSVN